MSRTPYKLPRCKKNIVREALKIGNVTVDELDCSVSYARRSTDKSIEWIVKHALDNKDTMWNFIYRNMEFLPSHPDYYDFGCRFTYSDKEYFLWIMLSVEQADNLIKKYKLKPIVFK